VKEIRREWASVRKFHHKISRQRRNGACRHRWPTPPAEQPWQLPPASLHWNRLLNAPSSQGLLVFPVENDCRFRRTIKNSECLDFRRRMAPAVVNREQEALLPGERNLCEKRTGGAVPAATSMPLVTVSGTPGESEGHGPQTRFRQLRAPCWRLPRVQMDKRIQCRCKSSIYVLR